MHMEEHNQEMDSNENHSLRSFVSHSHRSSQSLHLDNNLNFYKPEK